MAYKKRIVLTIVLLLLLLIFSFFSKRECSINLHYTLNYEGDSWDKNRTGFLWALSYLGAELPKDAFNKSIEWKDSRTFQINFESIGFNRQAISVLNILVDSLKATEQYKKNNYIDLAQFVTLTIGSSWHYYAITNVPATYNEFKKIRRFKNEEVFAVTHSSVAKHSRLLKFIASDNVLNSVFVAEEGEGDFANHTFKPVGYEVLDVMHNGQLRFAIYDSEGKLTDSSPTALGAAGKPAKCLWCHEVVFQPLFVKTDTLPGFMRPNKFQKIIEIQNELLKVYRNSLSSDVNFDHKQDHTLMELLYISYMEPSLDKLSQEWQMKKEDLKMILQNCEMHQHVEFDFMKNVYARKDIEKHAPFKSMLSADDVREPGMYEPDLLKNK